MYKKNRVKISSQSVEKSKSNLTHSFKKNVFREKRV